MGLFDIVNPFAPLKIVKDVIDGDSLSEAVENHFERKLMSAADLITPVEQRTAKYGDIIGVKRSLGYKHFGVYVGKGKVIHYASESGDFGGHISIHETTMNGFLDGDDEYFILEFPDTYGTPKEVNSKLNDRIAQEIISLRPSMKKLIRYLKNNNDYHLYSPKETVRRARSRIGESDYNLATNNCEHFAIWCKTGISESHQINMLINGQCRVVNNVVQKFQCDQCGNCCRNAINIPSLKSYILPNGLCKYFDEINNICKIYDRRPLICNVDEFYELYLSDKMAKNDFYKLNQEGCKKLKEYFQERI